MKSFNILVVFLVLFSACGQDKRQTTKETKEEFFQEYTPKGERIAPDKALGSADMLDIYDNLKVSDTLQTKFRAKVTEVCQAKGCWMKLQLEDGLETMVRFKDYGFFMPTDIAGKEVIVNGLAFIEEMSVKDQQHYAKDGGKSAEEIGAITEPKKTYGFEANGVLIVQ